MNRNKLYRYGDSDNVLCADTENIRTFTVLFLISPSIETRFIDINKLLLSQVLKLSAELLNRLNMNKSCFLKKKKVKIL